MKKKIHLFFRKSISGKHFSVENFYLDLFKNYNNKNFNIITKKCPLESKGIINRIYLIFWAFFNQGDINHITGDINFISFLLNKEKTINTILDTYSLRRLRGLKKVVFQIFWLKIPIFKSKLIIAISKKTKNEVIKFVKLKTKLKVIDLCVNSKFKTIISKKKNIKPEILIIGTSENKNIERVINSLKNLNINLSIVGILSRNQKNLLKKNKINFKNHIGISLRHLINKYKKCDFLVFASIYEGFGLPILEAQKVGRPVITSNIQPMKYVAGNGALLVNPKNVHSIRYAIKKLINNYKLRKKLINRGFKNVERFKKNEIISLHEKYYNSLLKNDEKNSNYN